MIGFKAFNNDLTCRGFQYEIGQTYEMKEEPKLCERGYHFCKTIAECYNYYSMSKNTRICEVEALGEIDSKEGSDKLCTNRIKILKEVTTEWQKKGNTESSSTGYCNTGYCNTGNRNTGYCNTGDWNTGNWNTGNRNTGYCNTGYCNTGYCNTGDYNTGSKNTGNRNTGNRNTGYWNTGSKNTGNRNTGYCNTGYCNTGDYNTGYCNTGDYNTGSKNTGNRNTGNRNTGYCNTGDWNTGNWNTGVFCTDKNPKIKMFDKESNWTMQDWLNCNARDVLNRCPANTTTFVNKENMSEEEKQEHSEYETIGGYLKTITVSKADKQLWWNDLKEKERQEVLNLPNFDKDIFFECTGIEVE